MDKQNNFLWEMTATADNTLSLNVALLLHYDWHIMKKTHTHCVHNDAQTHRLFEPAYFRDAHTNMQTTSKRLQQTLRWTCVYSLWRKWSEAPLQWPLKVNLKWLNIRGCLHAHFKEGPSYTICICLVSFFFFKAGLLTPDPSAPDLRLSTVTLVPGKPIVMHNAVLQQVLQS